MRKTGWFKAENIVFGGARGALKKMMEAAPARQGPDDTDWEIQTFDDAAGQGLTPIMQRRHKKHLNENKILWKQGVIYITTRGRHQDNNAENSTRASKVVLKQDEQMNQN